MNPFRTMSDATMLHIFCKTGLTFFLMFRNHNIGTVSVNYIKHQYSPLLCRPS